MSYICGTVDRLLAVGGRAGWGGREVGRNGWGVGGAKRLGEGGGGGGSVNIEPAICNGHLHYRWR